MILIVLDSSFLVAFHNERDVHHEAAKSVFERLLEGEWGPLLLPEYVFIEVVTVLAARKNLSVAVSVGTTLLQSREVEFVPCFRYFIESMDTFKNQGRIGLSFTDATIVVVCRERGASQVATFDAGFRKVKGLTVVPGDK